MDDLEKTDATVGVGEWLQHCDADLPECNLDKNDCAKLCGFLERQKSGRMNLTETDVFFSA